MTPNASTTRASLKTAPRGDINCHSRRTLGGSGVRYDVQEHRTDPTVRDQRQPPARHSRLERQLHSCHPGRAELSPGAQVRFDARSSTLTGGVAGGSVRGRRRSYTFEKRLVPVSIGSLSDIVARHRFEWLGEIP